MKKLIIIAITLMTIAATAYAFTDFKCMNDCQRKGYMYGYCLKVCSY